MCPQMGLWYPAVGDYVPGGNTVPVGALTRGPLQAAGARLPHAQATPLLYRDVRRADMRWQRNSYYISSRSSVLGFQFNF